MGRMGGTWVVWIVAATLGVACVAVEEEKVPQQEVAAPDPSPVARVERPPAAGPWTLSPQQVGLPNLTWVPPPPPAEPPNPATTPLELENPNGVDGTRPVRAEEALELPSNPDNPDDN